MKRAAAFSRQRGLTLIELLVALAVSMVIVIAATSLLVNTVKSRDTQDASGILQDNARYATDVITKSIQQSGFQNYIWNSAGGATRREVAVATDGQPDIRGFNNSSAVASSSGSAPDNGQHNRATSPDRVNNSDTLVVRYQGSGPAGNADGSMVNCLGQGVPQPASAGDRSYSVFYVSKSTTSSEPELFCKYVPDPATPLTFQSAPIVSGVESFQVLYGVDTDNDSFADQWLNAEQVDAVSIANRGVSSPWQLVKTVRVGLIMRSPDRVTVTPSPASQVFSPLGTFFSQGTDDTMTINMTDGRLRKAVTFTVNLRNSL